MITNQALHSTSSLSYSPKRPPLLLLLCTCCFARLFFFLFPSHFSDSAIFLFLLLLLYLILLIAVGYIFFLFLLSIILLRAMNYFDFLNPSYLLFSDLCVRGKRHLVRFFCSVFKIYRLLPCCDRDSPEGHASCCVSR